MELEKLAQKPLKNLIENSPQMPYFIGIEKLAVGGLVDRPVDRPTVIFHTVVPSVDRSVDRGQIQRTLLSVRSTARSTGTFPESRALWTVDWVGRPALQCTEACTLCTSVDRPGRPAEAWSGNLRDLKVSLFE